MPDIVKLSGDVANALGSGHPVVALESTIIAHGMPYPQNLATAREVEQIVRDAGAVPATIAVMDGQICVGLDEDQLMRLATRSGVAKLSRRDMAIALARGTTGATTVATTLIGAGLAGIRVFATGGIGGVHRGVAQSWDISADLDEIARQGVATVTAGAKAILDLPKTLEYLETRGVPVLGWQTDDFPAFYTRASGLGVDARVEDAGEIAAIMQAQAAAGLTGGIVVANPVPEDDEADPATINAAIDKALSEAKAQGIAGKAVTPFLLKRITELTGGNSLVSNIALVKNNARLAARIACQLAI